jgi:hypothetical protein|tara:strand:- start:2127 stop:2336 length:210 start_codon:yes stop_codon:yes gene_type:complete
MSVRDTQNYQKFYLNIEEYIKFNELLIGNPDLLEGYVVQYLKDDRFEITVDEQSNISVEEIMLVLHQEL